MVYWAVSQVHSATDIRVRDGYVHGDDAAFGAIVDTASATLADKPGNAIWATLSTTHVAVPELGESSLTRAALIGHVQRRIRDQEHRHRTTGSPSARGPYPTPPGSVSEQWARIEGWLLDHFPENSIPGADAESIENAVHATGQDWPNELVEFFGLVNGDITGPAFTAILPKHRFLTLADMVEERADMIRISAEAWGSFAPPLPPSAGEIAHVFAPVFIPFAGLDSNFLVVDTRPGDLCGCVTAFDKTMSDELGPRWLSISAMLTDLADSLTRNIEFDDGWRWSTEGNALQWDWSRADSVARDIARAIQSEQ